MSSFCHIDSMLIDAISILYSLIKEAKDLPKFMKVSNLAHLGR